MLFNDKNGLLGAEICKYWVSTRKKKCLKTRPDRAR